MSEQPPDRQFPQEPGQPAEPHFPRPPQEPSPWSRADSEPPQPPEPPIPPEPGPPVPPPPPPPGPPPGPPEGTPSGAGPAGPSPPAAEVWPGDYPPTGQPPGGYPSEPYGPGGYPGQRRTNTLAIVALVCSIGGFITAISAPVGVVLGHMAKRQIAQTGEEGGGLATAALIIGYIITGLILISCCGFIALVIASAANTG